MEAIVAAATTASSTPIALTTDEIKRAIVNPYAKANQNRKRRPPQDTPNDSRKKPCKQQLLAWNAAGAYDTDQHPSETSVAVVRLDGVRSTRNDGADTNSRKCNSFSPTESTIQTTKQSRNTHATAAVKRTGPTSSTRKKKGAVPGNERKANVKIQGPPPQLPFKSTSSSYSLGHLRVRDGIDFGWQGDVVGWNERLGRVYFNGFKLQNKLCSGCFKQGDTVQMKTKHVSASTYIIVAVFQATKSFLGDCYGNGDQHEIQKRGHPYMELQNCGKNRSEDIPDWLLDPTLVIATTNECGTHCTHASKFWSKKLGATPIHFYRQQKNKPRSRFNNLELLHHDDSSDDSGDYSCNDESNRSAPTKKRFDDLLQLSLPKKCPLHGLNLAQQATIVRGEPPVQLVVHNSADTSQFFGKQGPRNSKHRLEDDKNCVKYLEIELGEGTPLVNELRNQLRQRHFDRVHSPVGRLVDIVRDNETRTTSADVRLDKIRAKFYGAPFRSPQDLVCSEIVHGRNNDGTNSTTRDIFFVAPCGFGKSLCFVVAAHALGGITLVIEPLRALIDSQVKELCGKGVNVETLLTLSDAKIQGRQHAALRLNELAQQNYPMQTILFSTPEMICGCLDGLRSLVTRRLLSLIVIDEFDCIDESNDVYRKTYTELVPKLKAITRSTSLPFLFLSATASTALIEDLRGGLDTGLPANLQSTTLPKLFLSSQALPPKHAYSVERKINGELVVDRIAKIMDDYKQYQGPCRAICYCLTRKACEYYKLAFIKKGVKAEVFVRTGEGGACKQSDSEKHEILKMFHQGTIQVICATKALGRGVHINCPVRFIFHPVMPTSLTDYVQATGRGGRDGEICYCILFYRVQDCATVKQVLQVARLSDEDKKRHELVVENVCKYAMEGLKCRKFMLAQEVMSGVTAWDRQCAKCDNCRFRQDGMKHKVEISDLVFDLLNSVTEFDSLTDLSKAACCLLDSSSLCIRKKALIFTLLKFPKGKSKEFAILNSLSRFFTVRNHFDETVPKTLRLATWRSQLETKRLSIYLQYCKLDGETQQYQRILEPGQAWFDVDQKITAEPESKDEFSAKPNYPYLVQFELRRLEFSLEAKSVPNSLSAACELVYDRAGQGHVPYIHFLKEAEKANCLPASNKLFFRAELQSDGRLKFCEPEQVHPRRIFRMFGSDRFLDISVSSDVHETKILDFFRHPILVGGRTFRFLWCKKDKSPQAYVLFAEQGCGIPVSEECTVSEVIRRCIPQSYNPDLTLGKWAKRMKMSFSRTTEGCKLPPGSVMMLEDFGRAGVTEVDGAGLVSRSALEAIWEGYSKNSGRDPQDKVCPSGFQGRLAGFKGVWILDCNLEGFVLQCRSSQLKYKAPMKCIDPSVVHVDDMYETVEVCSFCITQGTTLNTRVIQILEHQSALAGKGRELKDFLEKCIEESAKELDDLAEGDAKVFVKKLRRFEKGISLEAEKKDGHLLFRMAAANVGCHDPEFLRRRARFIKNKFESMRDKAHYLLSDCCYVRLYPDHTLLLRENEAFLALPETMQLRNATEIVAMRSPSFFAGDLRRLSLVSYSTLLHRAQQQGVEGCGAFFGEIKNAVILSIQGCSEADRMSGGDYDGDQAWVSWNIDLLSYLPSYIAAEETSELTTPISGQEQQLWSEVSLEETLRYMIHFRGHQKHLGQLSEALDLRIDRFGFDDPKTRELGKAAFLQVDMPYNQHTSKEAEDVDRLIKQGPWPDWKNRDQSSSYQSASVLGWMWRQMTQRMTLIQSQKLLHPEDPDDKILYILSKCCDDHLLDAMKNQMATAVKNYLSGRRFHKENTKEEYYCWQRKYCKRERIKLIEERSSNSAADQSSLAAAVLYCQCFGFEHIDRHSKACEFAWLVAEGELLQIFSGEGSLPVSCERLPDMVRR